MKQQIRELLDRATAGGGDGQRTGYGYSNGDTYHQYTQRCRVLGMQPKAFGEWLAYELSMTNHRGPHVRLDDHQRFGAASQAG